MQIEDALLMRQDQCGRTLLCAGVFEPVLPGERNDAVMARSRRVGMERVAVAPPVASRCLAVILLPRHAAVESDCKNELSRSA